MIKKTITVVALAASLTSCVSSKVYKDLEKQYADLKAEKNALEDDKMQMQQKQNALQNEYNTLEEQYNTALADKEKLAQELAAVRQNLASLQESYDALEKKSTSSLAENAKKNRELLEQLEAENNRLQELKNQLDARSNRIDELEAMIKAKDEAMANLKTSLSNALLDFEGKGLSIEQRDGKIYVSMENKLLFRSGSWAVNANGRKAVEQLGTVLAQNPDISVLIEGHTDDDPYRASGAIEGNWDLSTKRATEIVKILVENSSINPFNLTAAGRSEFAPVATNDTNEGKAKNRRIEVVLTPKLDKITQLLSDVE